MSEKSILLIEHEESLSVILQICLSEFAGWHVILSTSIAEGIGLCLVHTPDAVLWDISGIATEILPFAEPLLDHTHAQAIPIVLLTDRSHWFTQANLNQMGFAGAVMKPFNPALLPTLISNLLGWNFANVINAEIE